MIGCSLRARGYEGYGPLHQHPSASVREKDIFVRAGEIRGRRYARKHEEGFARVITTVKEATSLVGIIQL